MTDKRGEALRLADALEEILSGPHYKAVDLRDAARLLRQWPADKGIPRKGCQYLAPADSVCNKCGEVHHHHQMLAQFYAAAPSQQPAPVRNEWKEAVLDQLADHALDAPQNEPPQSILRRIIDMAVTIALDPAVSSDAQALIDRGAGQQPSLAAARPDEFVCPHCFDEGAAPQAAQSGMVPTTTEIKAAFMNAGGSSKGAWLDIQGSWYTEGYKDGFKAAPQAFQQRKICADNIRALEFTHHE